MIGMDPKGFCNLEGGTAGIGWWWGEVGGVVAGSDGAVAEDGTSGPHECADDQIRILFLTRNAFSCWECCCSRTFSPS